MEKIYDLLSRSYFIRISLICIGIISFILLAQEYYLSGFWFAQFFLILTLVPRAYYSSARFNLSIYILPELNSYKNNGIHKKVKLNGLWRKLYCGDFNGNLHWWVLLSQSLLFVFECVFLLLNIVFLISVLSDNTDSASWIKLCIYELIVYYFIHSMCVLPLHIQRTVVWVREKKAGKKHVKLRDLIENDKRVIKSKRIMKQKDKIRAFLKPYGLHFSKRKYYILYCSDTKSLQAALEEEFPKLNTVFSESKKGAPILEIYDEKREQLLLWSEIKKPVK